MAAEVEIRTEETINVRRDRMGSRVCRVAAIHGVGRDVKKASVELDEASDIRIRADLGADAVHDAHRSAVRVHARMIDGLQSATRTLATFSESTADEVLAQDAALAGAAR